jgi:hypothetical protein
MSSRAGVLAAIACALVLPPAAAASSASVVRTGEAATLRYVGQPGEDNDLIVEVRRSGLRLTDGKNVLAAGEGCRASDDHHAVCQADRVVAYFGDGNDWISAECFAVCVPFELHGGAGNDDLAGSRLHDVIDGGPGLDNIDAVYGADRIFGGPGPDYIRAVTAGGHAHVSCGPGTDYVFPNPTLLVDRDCDGFGETGFGYSRFRARGGRLHLGIRTLGCPIGLRVGRHGPASVAEARPKRFRLTLDLPHHGERRAQLFARRLCEAGSSFEPLFVIAPR